MALGIIYNQFPCTPYFIYLRGTIGFRVPREYEDFQLDRRGSLSSAGEFRGIEPTGLVCHQQMARLRFGA